MTVSVSITSCLVFQPNWLPTVKYISSSHTLPYYTAISVPTSPDTLKRAFFWFHIKYTLWHYHKTFEFRIYSGILRFKPYTIRVPCTARSTAQQNEADNESSTDRISVSGSVSWRLSISHHLQMACSMVWLTRNITHTKSIHNRFTLYYQKPAEHCIREQSK